MQGRTRRRISVAGPMDRRFCTCYGPVMDLLFAIFHLFRNRGRKPLSLLSLQRNPPSSTRRNRRKTEIYPVFAARTGGRRAGDRFRRTASTTRKSARARVGSFGAFMWVYSLLAILPAVAAFVMLHGLIAIVILLGAELNAEIEHQTARDSTVGSEKPLGRAGRGDGRHNRCGKELVDHLRSKKNPAEAGLRSAAITESNKARPRNSRVSYFRKRDRPRPVRRRRRKPARLPTGAYRD